MLVSEFSTTNTGAIGAASTDRTTYQTSDKLGTAVLLMAASGLVVENNRTLPYGEEWVSAAGSANEQKFTSYQRDGESGLDYAIHRFDATTRGVFMSADRGPITLALPQSLNRYIYAMADPVNYTDPSGLSRETPLPPPLRATYWPSALEETIESYIELFPIPSFPQCDTANAANVRVRNFISAYRNDARILAAETGLGEEFFLAWAASESGWGIGANGDVINPAGASIALANNNFFGLTTPNWPNAIDCSSVAGSNLRYACFSTSGGSRYCTPLGLP